MDLLSDLTSSVQPTLRYVRALESDPPAMMSDRQKRRLAEFSNRYATRIRQQQHERYQAVLRQIHEDQRKVEDRASESEDEVARIRRAVTSGRMTGEEGRQELTKVFRRIRSDRAVLDVLDASAERAAAMIDLAPEIYQEQQIERFPNLRTALPTLSVSWLSGDVQHDPFGG